MVEGGARVRVVCIGCGCTDDEACANNCHWLRLDTEVNAGVCSNCPEFEERFDNGDRGEEDFRPRRPGELILPGDPEFDL